MPQQRDSDLEQRRVDIDHYSKREGGVENQGQPAPLK